MAEAYFVTVFEGHQDFSHIYDSYERTWIPSDDHYHLCRTFNTLEKARKYQEKLVPHINELNKAEGNVPLGYVKAKYWLEAQITDTLPTKWKEALQ